MALRATEQEDRPEAVAAAVEPHAQVELDIEGMTCASCVRRVERQLERVPGVVDAQVNLATEKGSVRYAPDQTTVDTLVDAVHAAGYTAHPPAEDPPSAMVLAIEGMTCASCVRRVERSLTKVAGVQEASVSLATEEAHVQGSAPLPALLAAVERAGYHATAIEQEDAVDTDDLVARQAPFAHRKLRDVLIGTALTIPLLVLGVFFMDRFPGENLLMLLLALPVWAYVGRDFHAGALRALRHGTANMDTLISLGSSWVMPHLSGDRLVKLMTRPTGAGVPGLAAPSALVLERREHPGKRQERLPSKPKRRVEGARPATTPPIRPYTRCLPRHVGADCSLRLPFPAPSRPHPDQRCWWDGRSPSRGCPAEGWSILGIDGEGTRQ